MTLLLYGFLICRNVGFPYCCSNSNGRWQKWFKLDPPHVEMGRDSWWYWFKCKHPELNICLAKGLNINKAQGLIVSSWNLFYQNLTSLYTHHQYKPNHIWNYDEIGIQIGRHLGVRIIAKKGFHQVYNTIPKSRKWLATNCTVNIARGSTLGFKYSRVIK